MSIENAGTILPSVAFIRHPFSRFASGYLERMVFEHKLNGNRSDYKWLRDLAISKYRKNESNKDPYPTPDEFAQYLIEQESLNSTHYLGQNPSTLKKVF